MGACGITIDPAGVQAAIDACMSVLRQPDSAANFLRGLFVVSVLAVVIIGAFGVVRSAASR